MRSRCKAPCRHVKLLKVDRVNGIHLVLPVPYKLGDTVLVEMEADADDSNTVHLVIQKFNAEALSAVKDEVEEDIADFAGDEL